MQKAGKGKGEGSGKAKGKGKGGTAPATQSGNGGGPPQIDGYLTSMWIEYCDGHGNVYTRWIDVTKVAGLIWSQGPSGPGNNPQKQPKLPGSKPIKIDGVTCADAPPIGGECCYWDGVKWVCPDDFSD